MQMDRRGFGKLALASSVGLATSGLGIESRAQKKSSDGKLPVYVFSKHLQFLNYRDMSEVAAEIGFKGLDLTVRPTGHVEPERAQDDLPKAVEAMRSFGLDASMMVTRISSVEDEVGIQSLKTASELGIKYYRMGYFNPQKDKSLRHNMERCRKEMQAFESVNRLHGLHGAYQNHAGSRVGAYVTDLASFLDGLDPNWVGAQYDIRHATVEGGTAWPLGLGYLKDYIRTVAVKDFVWKQVNGVWKVVNVPIGEGMVDFVRYFKMLRSYGITPQASLHLEYEELGGANKGRRDLTIPRKKVYAYMKQDLKRLQDFWAASA